KITTVKAAQYENAEIKGETFVAVQFTMRSQLDAKEIPVSVYAGKGVGKIDALQIHRNFKHVMLLQGNNGNTVMLSLEGLKGTYLGKNGEVSNEFALPNLYFPAMYNLFLQQAAMGQ